MPTLVIFDFDGPLFDGRSARNRALRQIHAEVCTEFGAFDIEIDQLPLLNPDATLISTYAQRQDILKRLALAVRELRRQVDHVTAEFVHCDLEGRPCPQRRLLEQHCHVGASQNR